VELRRVKVVSHKRVDDRCPAHAWWGNELAKDGEDPKQKKQDLLYILREDIINGHLDNSGPLWDGRRLGVACITSENKAGLRRGQVFSQSRACRSRPVFTLRPYHEGGGARFRSATPTSSTFVVGRGSGDLLQDRLLRPYPDLSLQ
jgi:hypothetical protein